MSTVGLAFKVALVYYLVTLCDNGFLSWQCLTRPIVIAPLTGLVLGDFHTGIVMGAELEAVFMGISAIGGSQAADATLASCIAVAYTILNNTGIEDGIALSLPIGTVMNGFGQFWQPLVYSPMAAVWEKEAVNSPNTFFVKNVCFYAIANLLNSVVLFVAIAFGVVGLNAFLDKLPPFIMRGLGAASSMMIGVGFAILTSMVWDNEIGIWFFVGYVLVAYAGLNTVAIALIGAAIAITLFFSHKRVIDAKNELLAAGVKAGAETGEEDFF